MSRGRGAEWADTTTALRVARLAYLGIIAFATLKSLHLELDTAGAIERLIRAFDLGFPASTPGDVARNFVLFAGWGCVWVVTARHRDTRTLLRSATLSGLVISLAVEAVQIFSPLRQSSGIDVAANTAGALCGAAAVWFAVRQARKHRDLDSYVGVPAFTFFGAYLTVAVVQASILVRPVRMRGARGNPLRRLETTLHQFDPSTLADLAIADVLWFIPLGVLSVAMLAEHGWKMGRAAWATAVGGVGLALASEVLLRGLQGLELSAGAVAMHALGIAMGASATAWLLPRAAGSLDKRRRALALATAHAALIAVYAWRPFRPRSSIQDVLDQLSLRSLLPLHAPGYVGMISVADVAIPFFLFLPLGGLLAVWPLRRAGWLGSCLPGLYLAVATEVLQLAVAGRTFSGIDLLGQCAGVVVGYLVLRLAGYEAAGRGVLGRDG